MNIQYPSGFRPFLYDRLIGNGCQTGQYSTTNPEAEAEQATVEVSAGQIWIIHSINLIASPVVAFVGPGSDRIAVKLIDPGGDTIVAALYTNDTTSYKPVTYTICPELILYPGEGLTIQTTGGGTGGRTSFNWNIVYSMYTL